MKSSPIRLKQKLASAAKKKKAARDLAYAKTPARRRKKRENQKIDRAQGTVGDGLDRHHTKSSAIRKTTVKNNRGNYGRGTKKE